MAEVISEKKTVFAPDLVTKTLKVTATSDTEAKAGFPVTIATDGINATLGNTGSKVLGILAEDATIGTTAVEVKVAIAGHVYGDAVKEADSTADLDKLAVTAGKIVIVGREEATIYG